ncbi:ABC-2 transporter permease [Phaeacidiphilus oryzae]|uniref:ABC transporter permease n=1 Tax=Phaeacidiphilus oryzae TaxID=348818 RepID=UPI00055BD818|nr:ABC transporter permease [Phaeacidiphilus oryzae]
MTTVTPALGGLPRQRGPREAAPLRKAPAAALRVNGLRVLRAEWAKFWSLRSSWTTLLAAFGILAALGLVAAAGHKPTSAMYTPGLGRNAVTIALSGVDFAQLAFGVLGVLLTAGEYATGTIRSTLSAVPRRLPVLWSKVAVITAIAAGVSGTSILTAFLGGAGFLHGTGMGLSLGDPGVLRSLLGAVGYLALVGVLGVALGALLRSVAGAVALLIVGVMLMRLVIQALPTSLQNLLGPFIPGNAGNSMYSLHQIPHTLSPGAGAAVLAGWAALALAGAAWRLRRTDV